MTLRNFFPLLGLRFFVTHYFLKPCSNTHSKLRFHTYYSHFKQMPGIVATYKQKQICLYNKGIIPNSISAYHHPSCEECREGRRVLISIILPNLKHSFICPIPVPVPVKVPAPVPDSGFQIQISSFSIRPI